ncbi:MAG TPA: DUF3105 domain-containing protein [Thermomicrobiales bacterium]|nr:DUF3105 domain-containing protein [Thermomicrobiales bacterium]
MSKQPRRKRQSQPGARKPSKQTQSVRATPRQRAAAPAPDLNEGTSQASDASARREARRLQRQQQDQRTKMLRIGGAIAALVILGALAWGVYRWWMGPDVSGDVTTYFGKDLAAAVHPENDTVILYEQVPPVGGPHNALWQTCGFYSEPIYNWHGVHAMEHGAVWLTYDPSLPEDDIETLANKADQGYVLVSPYPGLDAPVVGSVWGKQIKFTGADDERIDAFIKQYRLNPDNTPEPGATCSGGATLTSDQEPQQEPYQQVNPEATPIGGLTSIDATATAAAEQNPVATPAATPAGRSEEDATPAT